MNSLSMSTTGAINRAKALSLNTRRAKMKSIGFVGDTRIWQKLSKLVCQKSQDEIN
jgi:SET domain-containing protein